MRFYFPDINVWVAAACQGHQHHPSADAWFASKNDGKIGFSRFTQIGFLRLLTNPAVMRDEVMTPGAAWSAFDRFVSDDRVTFYVEPENDDLQVSFRQITTGKRFAHGQWPDAYLAAFAKVCGLMIVTFDRGMKTLAGRDAQLLR